MMGAPCSIVERSNISGARKAPERCPWLCWWLCALRLERRGRRPRYRSGWGSEERAAPRGGARREQRCVPGGRTPGSGATPRHSNFAKQSVLCYTLHSKEWGAWGAAGCCAAHCTGAEGWKNLCCVKYERGAGYELRHHAGSKVQGGGSKNGLSITKCALINHALHGFVRPYGGTSSIDG